MLRSKAPTATGIGINVGGGAATITSPQDRNDTTSSSKRMFPFRQDTASPTATTFRDQQQQEEVKVSVSNLRKLYSSLLEELAPLHHELGSNTNSSNKNANYRWKNNGTITVDGADDTDTIIPTLRIIPCSRGDWWLA